MLTQCCNILLCIFKHPILWSFISESETDLYMLYYQSIMYYMSSIICFPLFFHIYQIHTKHLPRSRRIIFYSPSIVENATNRLYEWTYCIYFHWSLPNCSNFIDVLQTFKYYDSARILNRNIYYVYKIRIKIMMYK